MILCTLTGCENNSKNSRNEKPYLLQNEAIFIDYLKEKYSEESFEILSWEYGNNYDNARIWYVKSMQSEIEFTVCDDSFCDPPDLFDCEKVRYEIICTYENVKYSALQEQSQKNYKIFPLIFYNFLFFNFTWHLPC